MTSVNPSTFRFESEGYVSAPRKSIIFKFWLKVGNESMNVLREGIKGSSNFSFFEHTNFVCSYNWT